MTTTPRRTRKQRTKSNVSSLFGGAVPLPQVNVQVIEALEGLLSDARGGFMAGIAFAAVSPQGHIRTSWAGNSSTHDMLAAADILHHRILNTMCDG